MEKGKHENSFDQDPHDERVWFINTGPQKWLGGSHPGIGGSNIRASADSGKLGIGERCILIQTPNGNVLWDLIAWIDEKTINFVSGELFDLAYQPMGFHVYGSTLNFVG